MPKNIIGGWRAFSLGKQANIGAGAAVNTLLNFEGEPIEAESELHWRNDDEITGELVGTAQRLVTKKLVGKHGSKLFPHLAGLFASMAMGKDTPTVVAGSTATRHKLEIDKTLVELPYRTMIENDGDAQFRYTGITCTGFTISGKRGELCTFEADLMGSGVELPDATAKPSRLIEPYLDYGAVKLIKGGTFDGAAVTGGTEIQVQLDNFKFTFKNNGTGKYVMGDASKNLGQVRRGRTYEITLEADLDIEDRTYRTEWLNGAEFALSLPIVGDIANGAARFSVEIVLPRTYFEAPKKALDDGTLIYKAKFPALAHPVHGPLVMNVVNLQANNYLA